MNYNKSNGSPASATYTAEEIAMHLFGLLDDCDTADDIAKADDALFRSLVRRAHQKRFDYADTDGYKVSLRTKDD